MSENISDNVRSLRTKSTSSGPIVKHSDNGKSTKKTANKGWQKMNKKPPEKTSDILYKDKSSNKINAKDATEMKSTRNKGMQIMAITPQHDIPYTFQHFTIRKAYIRQYR